MRHKNATRESRWAYFLCHDCGARVNPSAVQSPFPFSYLCSSCIDDLFLLSTTKDDEVCTPSA
jgi:hypothetical protein